VVGVAALLGVGWAASWLTREPSGPESSTFATTPAGAAAYADLLSRFGHPVRRLRTSLADSDLRPGDTAILLDGEGLSADDGLAARRFLESGGRLVVAGEPPTGLLERLMDQVPDWGPDGPMLAQPVAGAPEVAAVRTVRTRGVGVFDDPGSATPILSANDDTAAAAAVVGEGSLVLVADAGPFQNRLLARADNAAFAVAVAGGSNRPVAFVESVHGYGEAIGLAALPHRWWWVLGGVVIAALALMWARGARLGPAEQDERDLPPPRLAYVEALAASLARADRPEALARPLVERAQRVGAKQFQQHTKTAGTAAEAQQVGREFARWVKTRGGRL
jgi:hypothetical protein